MSQKLKQYRNIQSQTKSAPELIVMVYDGAIDNLKKAADLYRNQNLNAGHDAMEKAKKFLVHLYTTLDEEKGGDIAQNLSRLYAYLIERVNFIEATKDIKTIEECKGILQNIREGWVGLAHQKKSEAGVKGASLQSGAQRKNLSVSI